MTSYLCKCIGVSKSGYYNYLKNENKRIERDNKDQKDFDLILKAYKFKKRKKGARQIMMVLDNEFNVHFNLKKIRRLMKKFGLKCPIRQANPYRRIMKATQEHTTCENIINRVFKTGIPYNVLLTDITYLFYGDNKKCYLSTIKDAETNEILAYYISESMTLDISLETVKKLHRKKNVILNENVITSANQVYDIVDGDTVKVTVKGKRSFVETLKESDFTATADLSELSKVNAVSINVKLNKESTSSVDVDWNNAVLKVALEKRITKSFKVEVDYEGELSENYVLGEMTAKPNMIEVSCGESKFKKIDHVGVMVSLKGQSEDFDSEYSPVLYDANGDALNDANVSFSNDTGLIDQGNTGLCGDRRCTGIRLSSGSD